MILVYPFLWKLDEFAKDCIEKTVIFSVLSTIFMQTIISLYPFYKKVNQLLRKKNKLRESNAVFPINSVVNERIK